MQGTKSGNPETPGWGEYMAQYRQALRFVRGQRVLDVGCGQGFGSRYLFDNGALEVIGVDLENRDILRAQEIHGREGVGFISADAKNLTFNDGTFDVVTCFQVLETSKSLDKIQEQIARVLHPEGVALFSTVNRRRFSHQHDSPVEEDHIQEFDSDEFRRFLKHAFGRVDVQGLVCSRLGGFGLDEGTLGFLRRQFDSRVPWTFRDGMARKMFGISYYPDESEYVLQSLNIDEAPLLFAVCRK